MAGRQAPVPLPPLLSWRVRSSTTGSRQPRKAVTMERRVLLAIFLSFLVLYAYQAFFLKPPPKPVPKTATEGSPSTPEAPTAQSSGSPAGPSTTSSEPPPSPSNTANADVLVGESAEREIVAETRDVSATFTNRGARLKSWKLKRYKDNKSAPLELVPGELNGRFPLPLSLSVASNTATNALNTALYSVRGAPEGRS